MGLAADEARAVDHVGLAVEDRRQQARILAGIVLEVGVLNHDEVAAGLLEAAPQRRALALVHGLAEDADARVVAERGQYPGRTVRGAVVDDHDLAVDPVGERRGQHGVEQFLDGVLFVVDGDYDGQ